MSGNDLLNSNEPVCCSGKESEVIGLKRKLLNSAGDIITTLEEIRQARHTRSTNMNEATGDSHQGSSRGHAAIMLQILRSTASEQGTETYIATTLHVIDLAGAERPDKNDLQRVSGHEALMKVYKDPTGQNISTDTEAAFINMELAMLGSEILSATNCYKTGRRYRTMAALNTDGMRFVGRCLSGQAMVAIIVCLSQAPQFGWETWFSCEFGKSMAVLQTMRFYSKARNIRQSIATSEKNMAENEAQLARPQGIRKPQIRLQREALIRHEEEQLVAYRSLSERCAILFE